MLEWLFFLVFSGVIAWMIYSAVRYGGFKAAMFEERIVSTIGEVSTPRRYLTTNRLRVHLLDGGGGERAIGLELSMSAPGSWSMMPVRLSLADARQLASFLDRAATEASVGLPPA